LTYGASRSERSRAAVSFRSLLTVFGFQQPYGPRCRIFQAGFQQNSVKTTQLVFSCGRATETNILLFSIY
jgi:hypothetical protein